MKRFPFLFTCVVLISGLYAQNPAGKVNTKYLRPSITMLFSQPKDADEEVVISKFRNLEVNSKFDNHKIDFPDLAPIDPLNLQKNALITKTMVSIFANNKNICLKSSARSTPGISV